MRALGGPTAVVPYDPGRPCEIRVEFQHPDAVDRYRHRTGVEIVGPREVVSRGEDVGSAWRQFFF